MHPSDKNDVHQFYLMCDDVKALISEMGKRRIVCDPVQDEGWGLLTQLTLPGVASSVFMNRDARDRKH